MAELASIVSSVSGATYLVKGYTGRERDLSIGDGTARPCTAGRAGPVRSEFSGLRPDITAGARWGQRGKTVDQLGSARDTELREHVCQVSLHSSTSDVQALRDLTVAVAGGGEVGHLALGGVSDSMPVTALRRGRAPHAPSS